jgi:hypothetical protein
METSQTSRTGIIVKKAAKKRTIDEKPRHLSTGSKDTLLNTETRAVFLFVVGALSNDGRFSWIRYYKGKEKETGAC